MDNEAAIKACSPDQVMGAMQNLRIHTADRSFCFAFGLMLRRVVHVSSASQASMMATFSGVSSSSLVPLRYIGWFSRVPIDVDADPLSPALLLEVAVCIMAATSPPSLSSACSSAPSVA